MNSNNETSTLESEKIEELKIKIVSANVDLMESVKRFVKTANPELSEEQVKICADSLANKLVEEAKRSQKLYETLDSCQTMEDISAWRISNNI